MNRTLFSGLRAYPASAVLICCSVALTLALSPMPLAAQCPGCNDQSFIDNCYALGGFIDDVAARRGECFCIGGDSPIIIDTRGKGIKLTSAGEGVLFDLRGTGNPLRYSWTIPDSGNAFLVLDRNGDGRITSGKDMFGNYTAQPSSPHPNGFLALAEFDKPENGGNGDGVIDGRDAIFASLRLWIDANHNGISESEELFPLPSLGVYSISLSYSDAERRDRFGNRFRYRAKVNLGTPQPSSESGPWAYDVFLVGASPTSSASLAVPPPAQDPPNTIYGSKNPEKIPTDVVYGLFLRIAGCPENATSLQKKKCGLVRRAVGLDSGDQERLQAHLSSFLATITPLDQQVAELNRNSSSDKARREFLGAQSRDLVRARITALRQELSPRGRQQFDSYIESLKAKMKAIPAPTGGQ